MKHKFIHEWANWVATDADGDIVEYEHKPDLKFLFWDTEYGRCCKVGNIDNVNWQESLQKRLKNMKHEFINFWASYSAWDSDGELWEYEYEPIKKNGCWQSETGRCDRIMLLRQDWAYSLQKRGEQ